MLYLKNVAIFPYIVPLFWVHFNQCYFKPTWNCWILKMTHKDHSYFPEDCIPQKDGCQTMTYFACHLWIADLLWHMIYWRGSVGHLPDHLLPQLPVPHACNISVEPLLLQCLHKLEGVFCCTFLLAGSLTNEGNAWLLTMKRRYFPCTCEGRHG